jgi:hypothetical protein
MQVETLENRQLMSVSMGPEYPLPTHGHAHAHAAAHAQKGNGITFTAVSVMPVNKVAVLPIGFVEPKVDSSVTSWKDYSKNMLFAPGGPSPNDVIQGALGDCWFLASLSEVAIHDPAAIKSAITQRSDGTYDVRFHTTKTTTVDEHVDGKLPMNGNSLEYAKLGTQNCVWVPIMEKAFTYFRNRSTAAAYTTLNTGWGREALADLGGGYTEALSGVKNGQDLFNDVIWGLIFNVEMDFGTSVGGGGPLVHQHEYSVISARVSGGVNQIEVRNPWGNNPNFAAHNNAYDASNDGYMWVSASAVLPELDEFVTASA